MFCSLAVDIGASGGRHILGMFDGEKIILKEIYRFENNVFNLEGDVVWDVGYLEKEIINGIKECKKANMIPQTLAIDTWGVDYVLLNESGDVLSPVISYRDLKSKEAEREVKKLISHELLYEKTGIQYQSFNSIYQLYRDKKSGKLDNAHRFLMMGEYFSFKLTGVMKNEYTNATTTNLVNVKTKTWDNEILDILGIDKSIFGELYLPGTFIGHFTDDVKSEVGFDCDVIFCPSHDTASAVAACPISENSVYISSGTWSLMGTELTFPIVSKDAYEANFTNEGGVEYRYRFLKNIMGMWLLQSIRKSVDKKYSFDQMMKKAMESTYEGRIDPNDPSFVSPENMLFEIRKALGKDDLPLEDVLKSIYLSLAYSYSDTVKEIESITGKSVDCINIVGGGSRDAFLNRLTKEKTGKKVVSGPTEATAIGNLIIQFMYLDKNLTLDDAREYIKKSFDIREIF